MKTRQFFVLLVLLLSASFAFAQTPKMSFAVLGGVNLQNLNGKDSESNKLENDMILGFHAGVNVQIPVAPGFYFQPGILFSTKGGKNANNPVTATYKLSYVELPLNLVYKGMLGNGYVMIGFGPYVAYGIGGKAIFEGGAVSLESDIEFKNVVELTDPLDAVYFKALDAGANIFIGYEMASGIFIQLNSQLGMLNINPEDKRTLGNQPILKNTGFGVSLGYRF